MNIITCGALLALHVDAISQDKRMVFGACFALCVLGTVICSKFQESFRDENASKKGGAEGENVEKSGKKQL